MEAKAPEAREFRAGQREQWNVAATGWRKWNHRIDETAHRVSERMVELAEIGPGARVLDVACGYGEPTLTAARVVGEQGGVVATDISAQMLSYGRERSAAAGIENIEFVESAAVDLDFPEHSFDAALSRWGIIFDPDGEGAAARVRGFLKPGAKMVIASWGTPEQVPFLGIPMGTVMRRLEIPPPPPGTPGPLSRPTPEAVAGLLEGGGFSDLEVERLELEFEWESPEEFTTFVREIAPPVTALMADRPPEAQEEAWAAITEAAREASGGQTPMRLSNVALIAVGRA